MGGEGDEGVRVLFDEVGLGEELDDVVDGAIVEADAGADGVHVALGVGIAGGDGNFIEG